MIKHNLKPEDVVKINTHDIYRCLLLNKDIIPKELYDDCIYQIQVVLEKYAKAEVLFSPRNITYVSGKYNQLKSFRKLKKDKEYLDFFVVINNKYIPTLRENGFFFEPNEPLDKVNEHSNVLINPQENKIYDLNELYRWAYDIYNYNQDCYLSISHFGKEENILVAFYLLFLEPEDFNYDHLSKLFQVKSHDELKKRLLAIKAKYSDVFNLTDWTSKLELLEFSSILVKTDEKPQNIPKSKPGPKPKDFTISGPDNIDSNATKFNTEEVVIFFKLLQKHRIIASKKNGLSDRDLIKIVSSLSGYSYGGVKGKVAAKSFSEEILENIKTDIYKFINLINKELKRL